LAGQSTDDFNFCYFFATEVFSEKVSMKRLSVGPKFSPAAKFIFSVNLAKIICHELATLFTTGLNEKYCNFEGKPDKRQKNYEPAYVHCFTSVRIKVSVQRVYRAYQNKFHI
jgi:hypothetical protein